MVTFFSRCFLPLYLPCQAETYFAQNVSVDSGWVNTKLWDGSD